MSQENVKEITNKWGTIIPLPTPSMTRFVYANETHNILMSGLGTHERCTIETRFLRVPVFGVHQRNKHFEKSAEYNCRKIILGTLGFYKHLQNRWDTAPENRTFALKRPVRKKSTPLFALHTPSPCQCCSLLLRLTSRNPYNIDKGGGRTERCCSWVGKIWAKIYRVSQGFSRLLVWPVCCCYN